MNSIAVKAAVVLPVLGVALFFLAGTASASHVKVDVSTPEEITTGDTVAFRVDLHSADDGQALANVPVTLLTDASFGGVSGEVILGTAVTDETGAAVVSHQPRSAGEHEVRIQYIPPGETEPEVVATSISVGGASQLHRSVAGVQVPGLNVWLIMSVVAFVWAILFSVGLRIVAIARSGAAAEEGRLWESASPETAQQTQSSGSAP